MKIISYNINGIRAALGKGLAKWIKKEDPDIVCFQEIKANVEQIDTTVFEELGFKHFWYPAQKKGYSGVGILSKKTPDKVVHGIGDPLFDAEGRVLRIDIDELSIFSAYFPSGSSGDLRQSQKMRFLKCFKTYIDEFKQSREKIIVSGDYNICHKPIDIHDPVRNKNSSGFLPEERAWLDSFVASGFIDSFRYYNQEENRYSWWSYRARARSKNLGWRIDYNMVSEGLKPYLLDANIFDQVVHSDHCPIFLKINC